MSRRHSRNRRALLERESELIAVEEALSDLTGLRPDGGDTATGTGTGLPWPAERHGGLIAFAASAGLGKTTLLTEVRRRAAERGCTVLSARGGDQEQQVAFHVARQLLQPQLAAAYDFREPFPAAVTFPDAQGVHGELLLARGLHKEAAAELAGVGGRLDPRGMRNPAWSPWQLNLALAESHDTPDRARATALDAVARARQFGAASAVGHALRVAAEVTGGADGLKLLEESVDRLEESPSAHQLACSLVAHGAALRRAGAAQAAEQLHRGLDTARMCGADALAARAGQELELAGLRPRQPHSADSDTLTSREHAAALRAAQGEDHRRIAAALGIGERDVIRALSAVYRKLGTDPVGLPEALHKVPAAPAPPGSHTAGR